MDSDRRAIGIGLMGLGVVGSGVARILQQKADVYARQIGRPLVLRRVLVRDPAKARDFPIDPALLTTRAQDLLDDPEIDLIIEVMGGEEPAYGYLRDALKADKFVVTAQQRSDGEARRRVARVGARAQRRPAVRGERRRRHPDHRAAEARPAGERHRRRDGDHQRHDELHPHSMSKGGGSFAEALAAAQALGYAEPDPTNDVEGIDAAYKLCILATLAFHMDVRPDDVFREGITKLGERDFRYARELGYAIKLLAIGRKEGEQRAAARASDAGAASISCWRASMAR